METKYHRVYAKVNLDAIKHNIREIREHVKETTKVMAVIKADGYGHGAIPIGRELERLNIDYIAVAIYQEGILLRDEGIKTPILVLGNTPKEAFESLINYNLAQTVYSINMGIELNEVAKALGKVATIHLKIDTGMGRIGIRAIHKPISEVIQSIKEIYELENLHMEGIFTHFSKADEVDKSYTQVQLSIFNEVIKELDKIAIKPSLIHASNSAGLLDIKEAHFNMVRAGIAIYGLYPSEDVDKSMGLEPALSIISRVIFIKEVESGELISYGGTYETRGKTIIATIPIGYADGYSRALSNKGQVVIRGQFAPVIGRVCMDQLMIDVTHIESVCENDEVYLIGGTQEAFVSVEDIAEIMRTINYEVICLIGKRVPRVYTKENEVVDSIDYF